MTDASPLDEDRRDAMVAQTFAVHNVYDVADGNCECVSGSRRPGIVLIF